MSEKRVPELVPIRYGRMSEYMLNFRLPASPERRLMFDINDFDETLPGPWERDVERLSASLVIAGRANGFSSKERASVVRAAVRPYRERMRSFAGLGNLDVWYTRSEADELQVQFAPALGAKDRDRWERARERARAHDTLQVFDKLTRVVDRKRRIAPDPPLLVRLEDLVGVGSVGTRCWIVLLLGKDDEDPLFLQAKEADEPVQAPYAGAAAFLPQGERVVAGQRLMQATSDIFLGWERTQGIDGRRRDFYVRQLRDWKGIAVAGTMSYLGCGDVFDRAVATFAELYAGQNEKDHQALIDAIRAGGVPAEAA
ncbi:DUF2252 family protein [Streptomyces sp. NPDC049627]|uniref:DUF2252 family protein n=1 Tax=Streptomyces sp. NPDC049627 TaxID=3365595 RepID=UPI00379F384A